MAMTATTVSEECNCCVNLLDSATNTSSDSALADPSSAQCDDKIEDKESDAVTVCYSGCAACCHTFQHKHCTHHSHTTTTANECCKHNNTPDTHSHPLGTKAYFLKLNNAAIAPFDIASPTHCIEAAAASAALSSSAQPLPRLSWMDRLLSVWIVLCMVIGVLIGYFHPSAADTINGWGGADGTSYPIAAGLIVMMYPPLARVRYDRIWLLLKRRLRQRTTESSAATPRPLLSTSSSSQLDAAASPTAADGVSNAAPAVHASLSTRLHTYITRHHFTSMLSISLLINWVLGPLLMFFLAVACLPDKPHLIRGLIFVGMARCIAMVVVWNGLALGSEEYVCILVVLNSLFQIAMYSPYCYFFVSVFLPGLNLPSMRSGEWDSGDSSSHVSFVLILKSVAIYLGIPFVAGLLSWLLIPRLTGRDWYNRVWVKYTSPLTLVALCFTIIVLFILRGHTIATSVVAILRICVPLLIYFTVTFTGTLLLCYHLGFSYPDTVTQCFTAASNNFELAIAVSIASFGVSSDESLACVIGPLIEVPAMLVCVSVMRYARRWFDATRWESAIEKEDRLEQQEKDQRQRHKVRNDNVEMPLDAAAVVE